MLVYAAIFTYHERMSNREQLVTYANEREQSYRPSDEVLAQIGCVDTTLLIGYSGAGKDTLRRGTGLPVVVSDTIRPKRENNGVLEVDGVDYWFRGDELDVIHHELRTGYYVQYGTGPARNSFYGSRASAYPTEGPALLDVVAPQVPIMKRLPFRSIEAVFVTAPSYDVWMRRWEARGFVSDEDTEGRMREAGGTIVASLEDPSIVFIANDDQAIATAALHQYALTRHMDRDQATQGRRAAENVLAGLQQAA